MRNKIIRLRMQASLLAVVALAASLLPTKSVMGSHDSVSFSGASYGFSTAGINYYNDDVYTGPVGEDLDNDGDIDLVMPSPGSNEVSVLINDGNGAFGASANYAVGNYAAMVIVGDYSGDGYADLAVPNTDDGTITVLLNDGDGTFDDDLGDANDIKTYPTTDLPVYIAQGDVNNDNLIDLVSFDANTSATASVFINLGSGLFDDAVPYSTGVDTYSGGLVVDLNNDGFDDIAAPSNGDLAMVVLLNDGDGTFGPADVHILPNAPYTLKAEDLDNDSFIDLVIPQYGGDRVTVFLNDGAGNFDDDGGDPDDVVNYPAGDGANSVHIVDFNNDGSPDLVTSNDLGNTVGVLINDGGGTYGTVVEYSVGPSPFGSVTAADLNNDTYQDIIMPNYDGSTVSVLLNQGDGTFHAQQTFATNDGPYGLVVTEDLNNDSKIDIVVPSSSDPFVRVLLNTTPIPFVEFSTTTSSGAESVTNPVINIELSAVSDTDVAVIYTVTGGSATGGGTDYTLTSGMVTIAAGDTNAGIPLIVVNDGTVEADETVVIMISGPVSGILGSNTTHTYTITNDDSSGGGGGGGGSSGSSSTETAHPNGTLILDGQTIYLIGDQKRFGFRDPEEYKSYGYNFSQAVTANAKDKALPLAEGTNILKAMAGTLVLDTSDNRTVYMVGENGTKRGFTTEAVYKGLGYQFVDLYRINMADYPAGEPIDSAVEPHPEGALILDQTDKRTVWWVLGNKLHGFESEAVYNTYGFSFSRVVPANSADSSLEKGPLVKFRDGTLVSDSGTYYIISDGNKLPFASSSALTAFGYSLSNVITADLEAYTQGKTIK